MNSAKPLPLQLSTSSLHPPSLTSMSLQPSTFPYLLFSALQLHAVDFNTVPISQAAGQSQFPRPHQLQVSTKDMLFLPAQQPSNFGF